MTSATAVTQRRTWPAETPRLVWFAVPAAVFVGLTLLRANGITSTLWLLDDQIRYWDTALLPLTDQPLVGPRTHYGGYALGPVFYWVLWVTRVTLGPWVDNLPHAGAIGQVLLASTADTVLLVAVWKRTRSVWLALATVLLVATAPYDLALSATIWNPIMAAIAIKGATALVLLGWHDRSLPHIAATAALAWTAVHCNLPAVFPIIGIFAAIMLPPVLRRDARAVWQRASTVAAVVLVLQLPYLAHRIWIDPGGGGIEVITASLGQILVGTEALRWSDSAASLGRAVNHIQGAPWQPGWLVWVLVACAPVVIVRHRRDVALLAVTVLPLLVALVGYAFWNRDFDDYYYLSLMTAVVLTFQFGLTAVARGRAARGMAVALFLVSVAILPARASESTTVHRMPGYDGLVEGSKQILRRGVAVREIRADFLPPESNSEFIFTVLGGRIDPDGDWIATVAPDGLVSYEQVSSR